MLLKQKKSKLKTLNNFKLNNIGLSFIVENFMENSKYKKCDYGPIYLDRFKSKLNLSEK